MLETTLQAIAVKAGVARLSITEAKAWLRLQGDVGCKLASRLSKLSKKRNRDARPDVSLAREVDFLSVHDIVHDEVGVPGDAQPRSPASVDSSGEDDVAYGSDSLAQ